MLTRFFKLDGGREMVSGLGGSDFSKATLSRVGVLENEAQGGSQGSTGGVGAGLD